MKHVNIPNIFMVLLIIALAGMIIIACGQAGARFDDDSVHKVLCYSGGKIIFDKRIQGNAFISSGNVSIYPDKGPDIEISGDCIVHEIEPKIGMHP